MGEVENRIKFEVKTDNYTETRWKPKGDFQEVHPSCLGKKITLFLEGVDDLLWLGDFNKQALLHNTRERFSDDRIYTFIGHPILIAVNPYKHLNIYTEKDINYYKDHFYKLKHNVSLINDF